jgi:hypothetical protein
MYRIEPANLGTRVVPERHVYPRVVETDCIFDISNDEGTLDASEDEYLVWCQQPRNSLVNQPLSFWTTEVIQCQYPRLSRMAIDLFAIPAMSDEPRGRLAVVL